MAIRLMATSAVTLFDMNDVTASSNPPSNPIEGSLWFDGSKLWIYQGGIWEFAADGLEIGIRNILRNSTFNLDRKYWVLSSKFAVYDPEPDKPTSHVLKVSNSNSAADVYHQTVSNPIEINADGVKEFTLSFDIRVPTIANIDGGGIYFVIRTFDNTSDTASNQQVWGLTALTKSSASGKMADNAWYRYSVTFKPTTGKYIRVYPYLSRNGEVNFREIMLTNGHVTPDWTPAPEDIQEPLDEAIITLGNIANDNRITVLERRFIKDKLAEILGFVIGDTETTLPTAATLTSSGVGELSSLRKQAANLGIPTDDTVYVATGTAYNNLRAYLHGLTPKPWDSSTTNQNTAITISAAEYRDFWLKYYQAMDALAELIAQWTADTSGGTNLARYTDFSKWKVTDWPAYNSNTKTPTITNITLASGETIPFLTIASQNGMALNTTFGVQMGLSTDPIGRKMSLIAGKKYTLSFLACGHANSFMNFRYTYILNDGGSNQQLSPPDMTTQEVYGNFTTGFALTIYRVSYTFTARDTCPSARLLIGNRTAVDFTGSNSYGLFYLSRIQLEEGVRRTDWAPSHLDLIEQTEQVRLDLRLTAPLPTSISQDANGITAYTSDPTKFARLDYRGLYIVGGAIQIDGGLSEKQLDPTTANKINASPNLVVDGFDNFARFAVGTKAGVGNGSSVLTVGDTYYLTAGKSLKVAGSAATSNFFFASTTATTYNTLVTVGKVYLASCYIYTDGTAATQAKVRVRASNGSYYSTAETWTPLENGKWVRNAVVFTATTDKCNLSVWFDGIGDVWIDCLQLEEVPNNQVRDPSPWTSAGYSPVSTYIDANGIYTGTVEASQISVTGGKIPDSKINSAAIWNKNGTYIDGNGIYTGTVYASQVLVGDFSNLATANELTGVYGEYFPNSGSLISGGYLVKKDILNSYVILCDYTPNIFSQDDEIYFEFEGFTPTATKTINIGAWVYDSGKALLASNTSSNITITGTNAKYSGTVKLSNVAWNTGVYFLVGFNCNDIDLRVKKVVFKKKNSGKLIVDGSITFDQAVGGSIKLGESYGNGELYVFDAEGTSIGRIVPEGAYFPKMQSENIVGNVVNTYKAYTNDLFYFDVTNGNDSNSGLTTALPKKGLQAFLNSLPKDLNGSTITLRCKGTLNEVLALNGFKNGKLQIVEYDASNKMTVKNGVWAYYCEKIFLQSLDIHGFGGNGNAMIHAFDCKDFHCYDVKLYAGANQSHGFWMINTGFRLDGCHVYNITDRGLYASQNSRGYIQNCKGNPPIAVLSDLGSTVSGFGTIWGGSLVGRDAGEVWGSSSWVINYGEATPPTPPAPTETMLAVSASTGDNYSSQGFWTNDEVKQGDYGYGARYGLWYFDLSAIKGKTIKTATLTMYRGSGGASAARTVYVRSHAYKTRGNRPAGTPALSTANVTGSIAVGQTLSIDVKAFIQTQIASGTDHSLGVHTTGSTNYMSLGTTPTLTITYS